MTTLTLHDYGDPSAPTIVLLHGLTEAGTTWPDAVAHWASDWHLVAPDQRGHGSSPRFTPDQLTDQLATYRDDAITLLEQTGPAIVIGHSLGGRVATATALARPDLVRALVLEDPALTTGSVTPPGFIEEQHRFLDTFNAGPEAEIARMQTETTWSVPEIEAWARCKQQVDRAMIDVLELGGLTAPEAFEALRMPTLLLWDADGPLAIPPGMVANPLVTSHYLDGVSHCIRRDAPARYFALVDAFLERLPPDASSHLG